MVDYGRAVAKYISCSKHIDVGATAFRVKQTKEELERVVYFSLSFSQATSQKGRRALRRIKQFKLISILFCLKTFQAVTLVVFVVIVTANGQI